MVDLSIVFCMFTRPVRCFKQNSPWRSKIPTGFPHGFSTEKQRQNARAAKPPPWALCLPEIPRDPPHRRANTSQDPAETKPGKWNMWPDVNGLFLPIDWSYKYHAIFLAYFLGLNFREDPQKIWFYMVLTYFHFRILKISHWRCGTVSFTYAKNLQMAKKGS